MTILNNKTLGFLFAALACTALAATRWNPTNDSFSSSSKALRGGRGGRRALQSSSFESIDFSSFAPQLQLGAGAFDFPVNGGGNFGRTANQVADGGGSGSNFGQGSTGVDPIFFLGAAGGSGGGLSSSFGGGSLKPAAGGTAGSITSLFNGTNTGISSGFGGGFIGNGPSNPATLFADIPGLNFATVP